ncbi:unnamed protein product, partial [Ectocarpus sp. 12 AP-2014]
WPFHPAGPRSQQQSRRVPVLRTRRLLTPELSPVSRQRQLCSMIVRSYPMDAHSPVAWAPIRETASRAMNLAGRVHLRSTPPTLGAPSPTLSIEDEQHLEALEIALYQGDTRTRTIDISVDGSYAFSWTSSGTTSDFESIDLGVDGKVVELVGDLQDSEWLSILEVEILVDDGDDGSEVDVVEAGEMGTAMATADLYDGRLGDTVGCNPEGCTAALTRDGDMSEGSRWSCAPELGGLCSIFYDLGAEYSIDELQLGTHESKTPI